ncbi:MAG TPA: hypothetical protein PKA90_11745 [Ignavibacteria bacterium]|nr:hypothetical protein [Ignavibacteria bacterium]HMR41092.1 hypothetical protein [Ignavibacteria bacterium]
MKNVDKNDLKKIIEHTLDLTESGIMLLVVRLIRNNIIKSNMTKTTAEEMSSVLTNYITGFLDMDSLFDSLEKTDLLTKRSAVF